MPSAPACGYLRASRPGYVSKIQAEAIGRAAHALGAGRGRVGDPIDHGVGIVARAKLGDAVASGDVLLEFHHRAGNGLETARQLCSNAVGIEDRPPESRLLVLGFVN